MIYVDPENSRVFFIYENQRASFIRGPSFTVWEYSEGEIMAEYGMELGTFWNKEDAVSNIESRELNGYWY